MLVSVWYVSKWVSHKSGTGKVDAAHIILKEKGTEDDVTELQ